MQRGRGRRDNLFEFGDPFAGFGGFGRPGSLMSSFFGGRDPFDDPFFTRPFGGMMGPSLFGPSMFGPHGDPFGGGINTGSFIEQAPQPSRSRGPIIKELSSDDDADDEGNKRDDMKNRNTRKHLRPSKEPYVEDPDDEIEEKRSKLVQYGSDYNRTNTSQSQPQTFMFQSSNVTYGGPNGAYYTSSTTRRGGGDGIFMEESKEADTTTGRAAHRISRGMREKGHSVTRKLNSDGKVDTMQALHNLNEDELDGFEEAWRGNARQNLPGWEPRNDMLDNGNGRASARDERSTRALPAPHRLRDSSSSRTKAHPRSGSSKGRTQ